ncbi:verrucotoxin subunit beta-like [Silurus meridionalis]|nr:verrucotoxin subunit beta-like [Silurus meridionalis]
MDSVVLNSYTMGKWDNYLDRPGGPFVRGGAFDIIMVVNPENYEVIVNGLKYCTFNHRIPVDKVTTLAIVGDVFMNNFSIIELKAALCESCSPARDHANTETPRISKSLMKFLACFSGQVAMWSGLLWSIGRYIEVQSSKFISIPHQTFWLVPIFIGQFMGMFGTTKLRAAPVLPRARLSTPVLPPSASLHASVPPNVSLRSSVPSSASLHSSVPPSAPPRSSEIKRNKAIFSTAVMDSTCMEIAALGRPLYPGMLYDCRRDSFIPAQQTVLQARSRSYFIDVRQQPRTHLKFAASDTLSDKANLLDISGSLKASFLSGLVEVEGSAKYLHDNKSSAHQSRVTMQYSQMTRFEQLTMKELGHITYPQVFEQKTATHVVTAVLYGAHAFMVFDHTSAENENKQNVEEKLYAAVKKIPTISIEGEACLQMTEEEKKLAENVSVTFYGDFELEQNPTTYKAALSVYKKLPIMMNKQQNQGVPLTVWLFPLTRLDSNAAKLVREISMSLVRKTEKVLEEMGEVERRCNDLIKNQMTDNFPDVKARLVKFQDVHIGYKIAFQKALVTALPYIRGGTQEDKALGDILSIHNTSPFTADKMNQWLDYMMSELSILSSCVLKELKVVTSLGLLNPIILDHTVDVVICLAFTSLKYEDSYLAATEDFLNHGGFTKPEQTKGKPFALQDAQFWFSSPEISKRMRQNLSLFTAFSKANKNDNKVKFIIASISDSSNPGISIRLYQEGSLTDPNFQPVSKPPKPVLETSDEKVTLKFSKSPTGETVRFRVEYRMTPPTDSATDVDTWKVTDTSDAQTSFTLTELTPGEQYWVRYRAVSDVGVSEASDSVHFTFRGQLTIVMKGQSWNLFMPSHLNELRTEIMTSMGMSRWSLSTIKSEITNVVGSPDTPYKYAIPGGLRPGMAFYVQGVVSGQTFMMDFLTNEKTCDDITFHLRHELNALTCCNSFRNGEWDKEEHTSEYKLSEGSAFDIFIVIKTEGFENWTTSTFNNELNSGISRTKLSDIQSDVPHPVSSPVIVNGLKYCTFNHRIPVEKVTTLGIFGDVFMNKFSIIKNVKRKLFSVLREQKIPLIKLRTFFTECNSESTTVSNITATTIADAAFPFGFNAIQFDLYLDITILQENLAAITEKVVDTSLQMVILNKLNQSKAVIMRYLSMGDHSLGSAEINVIGSYICTLDISVLENITPESLMMVPYPDLSSCSFEQKSTLYIIVKSSFSNLHSSAIKYYQLMIPYLGKTRLFNLSSSRSTTKLFAKCTVNSHSCT